MKFFTSIKINLSIVLITGCLLLLVPFIANAADDKVYIDEIGYTLEQPFGNTTYINSAEQYIDLMYSFAAGLGGIIAVVLIMFGGMQWILAAGNDQKISTAKEIITSAVLGLLILLLSYFILQFINPRLVEQNFSVAKIPIVPVDTDLTALDPCNNSAFKGKDCSSSDTGAEKKCEEIACGDVGIVGEKLCRGIVCDTGTGRCYRGPKDMNDYACQNYYCGEWAQKCAESDYKKYQESGHSTEELAYNQCTCDYYIEQLAKKNLKFSTLNTYESTASPKLSEYQQYNIEQACMESYTNDDWEASVADNPSGFIMDPPGGTISASAAATIGWNCGFSCKYRHTIEVSGSQPVLVCESK